MVAVGCGENSVTATFTAITGGSVSTESKTVFTGESVTCIADRKSVV